MANIYVISKENGKFTWLMVDSAKDEDQSLISRAYILEGTYKGKDDDQVTTCTPLADSITRLFNLPAIQRHRFELDLPIHDPKGDAIIRAGHEQMNLKFYIDFKMTADEIQADLANSKGQTLDVEQTLESFKAEVNKIADKLAGKKVDGKKLWHWNGKAKAALIRKAADKIVDGVSVAEAYEQMKGALQWQRKFTLFQGLPGQKLKRGTPKNLEALCEKFDGLSFK